MVTMAKGLDCIIAALSWFQTAPGAGSAKDADESLQDCDKRPA
jgi:hypothetical protein